MAYLQKASVINASIESVFNKHATLANLRHILNGILDVEFVGLPPETLFKGQEIDLYLGFKGISRRCLLRVEDFVANERIEIRQTKGLFRSFRMLVQFSNHGENATLVTDLADYRLPLGLLGHLVDDLFLKEELDKLITNRHQRLTKIFEGN